MLSEIIEKFYLLLLHEVHLTSDSYKATSEHSALREKCVLPKVDHKDPTLAQDVTFSDSSRQYSN